MVEQSRCFRLNWLSSCWPLCCNAFASQDSSHLGQSGAGASSICSRSHTSVLGRTLSSDQYTRRGKESNSGSWSQLLVNFYQTVKTGEPYPKKGAASFTVLNKKK